MSSQPLNLIQVLLLKAAEDENVLRADHLSDSVLGFHAQQAVEKLLKALASQLGLPIERTHDLVRLNSALTAAGETLPSTPLTLSELNDFAVVYRYDLLFQSAGPDNAELIETVRLIREHVVARIGALSGPPHQRPLQ